MITTHFSHGIQSCHYLYQPFSQNRANEDVLDRASQRLELLVQLLPGGHHGYAVVHPNLPAALLAHVRSEEEGPHQRLEEEGRLSFRSINSFCRISACKRPSHEK